MDAETMPAVESATQDGGAKRRQVMEGARTIFLSEGFDGASMNDIARAAGVSKGTLYAYFDSKEQLFEALIREGKKEQAERLVFPGEPGDAREITAARNGQNYWDFGDTVEGLRRNDQHWTVAFLLMARSRIEANEPDFAALHCLTIR